MFWDRATGIDYGVLARPRSRGSPPAFRGLLSYNGLFALYLATLGAAGQWNGLLLWPAAVLHAVIALALLLLWRRAPVRS